MGQYINKTDLVSKIEKRYKYWKEKELNSHSIESEIRMSECQHLMLLLNNFEVKEVDLENEIKSFTTSKELYEAGSAIKAVAEHFYKLGLKAQKEE